MSVIGCSEPPVKEHEQAVAAIAAARDAGAAEFAADALRAAEESLAHYNDFLAQNDYRQALGAALDARDRAVEASRAATAERTRLEAEFQQLTTTVSRAADQADAVLKTRRPRGDARKLQRLRRSLQDARAALQESRTFARNQRFRAAIDRLNGANAALTRDLDALNQKPAAAHG